MTIQIRPIIIVTLTVALLMGIVSLGPIQAAPSSQSESALSLEILKNAEYQIEGPAAGAAPLTGGRYEEEYEPGAATKLEIRLLDEFVSYGDLDGDGAEDAAVVLVSAPGGSGVFFYLAAVLNENGEPNNVDTVLLGDRVELNELEIEAGKIIVDLITQGSDDPFCCPTEAVSWAYTLRDERLVAVPSKAFGRLFPYSPDGVSYGYINILGETVVEPQFVVAREFSEGRAAVSLDGELMGYLDQQGAMVIEPQFSVANDFSEGMAVVTLAGQAAEMAYIDRGGNLLFEGATFDSATTFREGLAAVQVGEQWGYIDLQGQLVVEPQYEVAESFAAGLAAVRVDGQYGYIEHSGDLVIESQFELTNPFANGLASVSVDDKYGYIDHQGRFTIEPAFDLASDFSEGLALVRQEDREFYINPAGEAVIDIPELELGSSFAEGLAGVIINGALGFINRQGEVVIEPQFIAPRFISDANFENGIAQVQTEEAAVFIDPGGQFLLEMPVLNVGMAGISDVIQGDGTQIVEFIPAVPEESAEGSCFTNALNRPYAWRCTAGNRIYDPCLFGEDGETLVCGANPATGEPGLALEQTEPLPEPDVTADRPEEIWLFELANGEICGLATGATVVIDDKRNNYLCDGGSALFGEIDTSGDVWRVERITVGRDGAGNFIAESSEMVEIAVVWQPVAPSE